MNFPRRIVGLVAMALGFWGGWKILVFDVLNTQNLGFLQAFALFAFLIWIFTSLIGLLDMVLDRGTNAMRTTEGLLALAAAVIVSAFWAVTNDSMPIPSQMQTEVAWWVGSWIVAAIADIVIWTPESVTS